MDVSKRSKRLRRQKEQHCSKNVKVLLHSLKWGMLASVGGRSVDLGSQIFEFKLIADHYHAENISWF